MKKQFKSYIIQSLIDTSILIALYVVAFAVSIKGNALPTLVVCGVGTTLGIQLLIAYFTSVYGEQRGTKSLNLALIITLAIFFTSALISLIYIICIFAGAQVDTYAFSIATSVIGWVFTIPYFIVSVIFAVRMGK